MKGETKTNKDFIDIYFDKLNIFNKSNIIKNILMFIIRIIIGYSIFIYLFISGLIIFSLQLLVVCLMIVIALIFCYIAGPIDIIIKIIIWWGEWDKISDYLKPTPFWSTLIYITKNSLVWK